VIPPETVLVGRPPHALRSASPADRERVAALREHQLGLTGHPGTQVHGRPPAGVDMGQLYAYRGKQPEIAADAILFDSAEITGDVVVGAGTVIGAGVKIIGDSHGPVRIGARVQILENTVLHLLPDNELIVEDDVVIGPGSMIHGCHLGAGSVIEPAAIVCDWSRVGAGSVVRAGACVTQRTVFGDRTVIDGFPAKAVGTLDAAPARPAWAFDVADLGTIARVSR
jgi:carbonic anhydrase/acetyltransferase-like protein (isoleucine patch superfamily)